MDETAPATHDPPGPPPGRGRYRLPIGLPARDDGRRTGLLVSVVVHALLIGLLIVPFFFPTRTIERMRQGAGGAGPSGGGGGGTRESGGARSIETLRFVKVVTTPVATPTTIPAVPAPVVPPAVPKFEAAPPLVTPPEAPPPQASAPVQEGTGTGGSGSGTAGTTGAGPGSGGGVGAGAGAGRGGGTGPGTGGGTEANYSPVPIAFFLPPLPAPSSVRGTRFTAEFDVDSTGRVIDFKFTETPDRGYNRQLASSLRAVRFRPGTRPDGTPVRMKAQLGYDF